MLCECQQRQATIHEVILQHGQKVERHLCEQCASLQGVSTDPHMPISQLISNYISGKNLSIPVVGSKDTPKSQTARSGSTLPCPVCSMTFAKFKDTGLLGCPSCYTSFQKRLSPLIARAHDNGEQHIGKVPRRALASLGRAGGEGLESLIGGVSEREQRLGQVRDKLNHAVAHEDYERAAMLRDEMTRLASLPTSPTSPTSLSASQVESRRGAGSPALEESS
ncbi:MAG: UvrB/UvrC motif-containing protein [Phycisphaerales bacterium]|nr:UvrB/UvrC motif-containing protein [Phycisphaerales bacterium]